MDISAKTIRDTYGTGHTLPGPYTRMSEIQGAHKGYWFTQDAMRFFGSRLPSGADAVQAGRLFISSFFNDTATTEIYTVRIAADDGSIEDAVDAEGKEMQFDSLPAARKALKTLLYTPQVEEAEVGGLEL